MRRATIGLCVWLTLGLNAGAADMDRPANFPSALTPITFDNLSGWDEGDHRAAYAAFARSCVRMAERPYPNRAIGVSSADLAPHCAYALGRLEPSELAARQFFETRFKPVQVESAGLLTGYFEPEVEASRTQSDAFPAPLHALPPGLEELPSPAGAFDLDAGLTWGIRDGDSYIEHPDRAAIMAGALDGKGLEIAWLRDPVEAFFIHIQGSARLRFEDGSTIRVGFAGKSGHAYTAIGRTLVERGAMALEDVTMDSIRDWLAQNPEDADTILATNRSYIFFEERVENDPALGPIGAASVQLTPGRSLAVDRQLYGYGLPVFVSSPEPLPGEAEPFQRLMVMQDTGSAIVGAARGDLFVGSGASAGHLAGRINQPVSFTLLIPNTD